jgi:hypothetical protein
MTFLELFRNHLSCFIITEYFLQTLLLTKCINSDLTVAFLWFFKLISLIVINQNISIDFRQIKIETLSLYHFIIDLAKNLIKKIIVFVAYIFLITISYYIWIRNFEKAPDHISDHGMLHLKVNIWVYRHLRWPIDLNQPRFQRRVQHDIKSIKLVTVFRGLASMRVPRNALQQRHQCESYNLLYFYKDPIIVNLLSLEILFQLLQGPLRPLANNAFILLLALLIMPIDTTIG